ncbi:hypothetical protein BDF14DRAFT_1835004 [Spinellus fusiger]|nr:hypothetical protein BDF14DRAFT_1835004 [Spinellus fusiger]
MSSRIECLPIYNTLIVKMDLLFSIKAIYCLVVNSIQHSSVLVPRHFYTHFLLILLQIGCTSPRPCVVQGCFILNSSLVQVFFRVLAVSLVSYGVFIDS